MSILYHQSIKAFLNHRHSDVFSHVRKEHDPRTGKTKIFLVLSSKDFWHTPIVLKGFVGEYQTVIEADSQFWIRSAYEMLDRIKAHLAKQNTTVYSGASFLPFDGTASMNHLDIYINQANKTVKPF